MFNANPDKTQVRRRELGVILGSSSDPGLMFQTGL